MVAAALRRSGLRVEVLADGHRLLDRVVDWLVDGSDTAGARPVVIADAVLVGFSGVKLAAGLRRLQRLIPIILLFRRGQRALQSEAWASGVTAIFIEPLNLDDLGRFVRGVLFPVPQRWDLPLRAARG
jgi:DNA-binding response OmpR family regulator